jgi:hypothetical protein
MSGAAPDPIEAAALNLLQAAGAGGVAHTGGSLLDHLRGVHSCLRAWGCAPHVAYAGLCHSVYGTTAFEHALFNPGHRAELREVLGEKAEWLVYCFGAATLRSWLVCGLAPAGGMIWDRFAERTLKLTSGETRDLLCIALADCLEQLPRRRGGVEAALSADVRRFWDRVAVRLGSPMEDAWRRMT